MVLLNRAPTLHRLGIQAFYPILIEGESIRIHPLVCKAFNADFDGDQMAVHLPLSDASQKEAREIMLSTLNLLKPATGFPIATLYQDVSLGCYYLTKIKDGEKGEGKFFLDEEEALLSFDFHEISLHAKIKVKNPMGKFSKESLSSRRKIDSAAKKNEAASLVEGREGFVETSAGRIIFNQALPREYPFQNQHIKVKDLEKISRDIVRTYSPETAGDILDRIKELGFEYSTWSGVSWGLDDLIIPPEKPKIIEEAEKEVEKIDQHYKKGLLTKEEKGVKIIEIWSRVKTEIEKLVPLALPKEGSVFQIIDSGSRGSWGQPVQMTGMKGLVVNPAGQIIELPVKSSYKEGFDVLEYFISTHGARKGTADTALRTSTAGYLTRRLVDVSHDIIVLQEDCKDEEGFIIYRKDADEIGQNLTHKILGRVCLDNIPKICKKGEIIDWQAAEKIIDSNIEKIRVRSPLTCKLSRGVCQKCYGWDLGTNRMAKLGEAVGIVAAQAIGEPGTQLTMRTFHTGGVAGGGDITSGLPRVQEIFEARTPGGKAQISEVEGKVLEITAEKVIRIKPKIKDKKTKQEILEYKIPAKVAVWVEQGQEVKAGQQLCEGNLDLKELFKLTGKEETQRYIIKGIQKIYVSQGALISDKHIEVICRQMFSRVKIKDSGDSIFSAGEVIERMKFIEENARLKKEKKNQAKGVFILLGMSRVALTTDSFLSAASFQETSRVLIKASLEGKEDKLRGLKENVIIGKLIPAGTGFRHGQEKEEKQNKGKGRK